MKSSWDQEKYIDALKYAAAAHKDQKVPGTDLPYVVHVAIVAMEIIAALNFESGLDGDLAVQCALLHDVIEDAGKSLAEIQKAFGREVADGVLALTKNDALAAVDKQLEDSLLRIKSQPREIWMVKMADRIANLQPPPAHWSLEKRMAYRQEAIKIHEALKDAGPYLANRLYGKIKNYNKYLN